MLRGGPIGGYGLRQMFRRHCKAINEHMNLMENRFASRWSGMLLVAPSGGLVFYCQECSAN